MATKPLDKMTKPELVKALKAAQKRIAKLEGMTARPPPLHPEGVKPGPYDVVHVTQGPDTVSDLVPPAFPWNTDTEDGA